MERKQAKIVKLEQWPQIYNSILVCNSYCTEDKELQCHGWVLIQFSFLVLNFPLVRISFIIHAVVVNYVTQLNMCFFQNVIKSSSKYIQCFQKMKLSTKRTKVNLLSFIRNIFQVLQICNMYVTFNSCMQLPTYSIFIMFDFSFRVVQYVIHIVPWYI